jgi:hypothetical protein
MTPEQFFARFLDRAAPGESCIYHDGFLACDRMQGSTPDADIARRLARQGFVFLTQRRIGSRHYEYIATKASRPLPELTWNACYDQ